MSHAQFQFRRDDELRSALLATPLPELLARAAAIRDDATGSAISYSRKVFIPLTQLCRDVCHYCTFAQAPRRLPAPYLEPEAVLAIARAGERAGCTEALFTLGDKPERRYAAARTALARLGAGTTLEYLAAMCELVLKETSLLPHVNPGVLTREDITALRRVSVSQGLMLETASARLSTKGQVHWGSPDKLPARRLETLRLAGELAVPFTSGILIGIGETRDERIDTLLALRDLHLRYGHLQEIIVQNFRAKPGTKLAQAPEPDLADLQWTIAAARIVCGGAIAIQAPPNLTPDDYPQLIAAGISDWGGISPVTIDHVNPEAAWPEIAVLAERTAAAGKTLVPRLPLYPAYARNAHGWVDAALVPRLLRNADSEGFARDDAWSPGAQMPPPAPAAPLVLPSAHRALDRILAAAVTGHRLHPDDIVALFAARGPACDAVCTAADAVRATVAGDTVRYVVNRNLNYTNVCHYHCAFCAFSRGKANASLRGKPYDLEAAEVARRVAEAWQRGATEVCMQGGIHPDYTGATYLALLRAAKAAAPAIHVHAFSPLEVAHGAATLGIPVREFLAELKAAGLGTLPGTAAEILHDDVRRIICPDKLTTQQWLAVVAAAHEVGLRTTSTIMFGHVDESLHWAAHLLAIRDLQERTGGFTEFVPLPFVHMEAPLFHKGAARAGPTWREAVLMHAVARLALHPLIPNIQVSWVKMGRAGALRCLAAGANDLGGTLMNESISRAAGTTHGQELPPAEMDALIASAGRRPMQRTTLYAPAPQTQCEASYRAEPLTAVVLSPAGRYARLAETGQHARRSPTRITELP